MIFKRFFQPKYQHKDPAVRIQALQELNPDEAKQKSILHELAFNDSHVAVSLAALDRLNNFDLWWKMALTSKDQRVAKKSRSKVEACLLGKENLDLSTDNRRTFILECQDNAILDLLLKEQGIDENDTELMLSVLSRLNKPQLNLKLLLETQNPSLQKMLFEQLTDSAEISKVAKKAKHPELVLLAQQKLTAIQEAKDKPLRLQKQVTMVLSKLLALSDKKDYQTLVSENDELTAQFTNLRSQFDVLNDEIRHEFEAKYSDFASKIQRKLNELGDAWQQEQEALQRSSLLQAAHDTANSVIAKVNAALDEDASAITLGELEQFSQSIEQASQSLQDMVTQVLSASDKRSVEALIQKLLQCRSSLDNLPALQTAIKQAQELIDNFAQLAPPNDYSQLESAQQQMAELTAKWREIREPYADIWPVEIEKAWQKQRRDWTQTIKQLRSTLDDEIKRCRGKCNLILGQIKKGSFKNALRHYETLQSMYAALPESQLGKIQKQYESVKEEIENLKDWQDYIATPRKPELVAEIEQLVEHPLEPEQQAAAVKRLRQEWNSLGKTGSENDAVLNRAFDEACELAFKPCRDFYAQQDVVRESNFKAKLQLLDDLEQLSATGTEGNLDKAYAELRKRWKAIGETDFKVKAQLDSRYQAVVNPVKQRLNAWYQETVTQKESLIKQVEGLVNTDDLKSATSQAIALQEQWKSLNRADAKNERRLWEKFRAVNDILFDKRNAESRAQQAEMEERLAVVTGQVEQLATQVDQASTASDFADAEQQIQAIKDALQALPKKLTQQPWKRLKGLREQLQSKRNVLNEHQDAEQYRVIFEALRLWTEDYVPDGVSQLSHFWRGAFQERRTKTDQGISALSRQELLVMMEIIHRSESDASEQEMRKALQLQLMTLKLQDGNHIDLDSVLATFIAKGPLSEADKAFLVRLQKLFVPSA